MRGDGKRMSEHETRFRTCPRRRRGRLRPLRRQAGNRAPRAALWISLHILFEPTGGGGVDGGAGRDMPDLRERDHHSDSGFRGRLIDPTSGQVIKQDPHPVHAYAAAGHKAPQIVTLQTSGESFIQCPRCNRQNPLASNNCLGCGLPFTMDGTAGDSMAGTNTWAVASLVLGIVGLPSFYGGCSAAAGGGVWVIWRCGAATVRRAVHVAGAGDGGFGSGIDRVWFAGLL